MYDPKDDRINDNSSQSEQNNTTVNETETAAPAAAPQAEAPSSGEYHYTASEVRDRAPSGQQPATSYTAPTYGPQGGSYSSGPYAAPGAYASGGDQPQQQPYSAYTWNTQQAPYYNPYQQHQQQPPKPKKKRGAKFGLKLLAAVLACCVVSLGSVGVFAALIQTGVVNVQNPEDASKTAAFTIYKQAEDSEDTTPTVTQEGMTAQEIAQKLIPSVVCVQNYQVTQQMPWYLGTAYDEGESGSEVSPAGEGSGVIFSEDGYIVTNQHVVDGATSLKVVTSDGTSYEAQLVGEDTQTDLAVLKIEAQGLTPAEFGSSEDLQVADEVMAIGNPGGLQLSSSVTMGYVSALNRAVTNSETGYTLNCIQTDAAINPGNSGGALVDMNGHVVGINSSKIAAVDYEGLGFAIPSDTVQPVVSDLIEYGYVKDRPMLGITGQYVDRLSAGFYGLSQGYYVAEVVTDNAKASGLQQYDVITAIDDTQVTSASTISNYIANKKPGDTVTLTVDRALAGEEGLKIDLVLSENSGSSN